MAGVNAIKPVLRTAGSSIARGVSTTARATAQSTRKAATHARTVASKTKKTDNYTGPKPKPKPYSRSRPSYAPGQVRTVWNRSRTDQIRRIQNGNPDGLPMPRSNEMWVRNRQGDWVSVRYQNPNGRRPWDMGHVPGQQYRDMHRRYMNGDMSKREFLDWYQNPNHYRVEHPGRNRARMDE